MPYSKEIYLSAKERLHERRQDALRAAEYTRDQLYHDIPRLREINSELMTIGASIAKCVLRPIDGDINALKERSLALQTEEEKILSEAGISPSVFEPRFHCKKCCDTGYIELNNRTVICDCLNKLMAEIVSEHLNADLPLEKSTFESFSLKYYPSEPDEKGHSSFNRMSKILNYCRNYADTFNLQSKSLLLRGATGLGKTHLSLAIANEVINKGYSVIYVTAPEILSQIERERFTHQYSQQEDTFNSLQKCDLLILDDLGTEFVTSFTISCVYNLINTRILSEKPMIISTNLKPSELITTYSQRFVSRLRGSFDTLEFIGKDIRKIIAN